MLVAVSHYILPQKPSHSFVTQSELCIRYGALDILQCLTVYLLNEQPFMLIWPQPEDTFSVYRQMTIKLQSLNGFGDDRQDIIRAGPVLNGVTKEGGQFDTVLIHETTEAGDVGVKGKV